MAIKETKEVIYSWQGTDRKGKRVKGEMKASGESFVRASLRRQGINVTRVRKASTFAKRGKVTDRTSRCSRASSPP